MSVASWAVVSFAVVACSGGSGDGGPASPVGSGDDDGGVDAAVGGGCATDGDCRSQLPQTTPAGCAVAKCDALAKQCRFLASDADGDGHADAACKSTGAMAIVPGDDCDDTDPTTYPGAPDTCDGKNHTCGTTHCACATGSTMKCNAGACNETTVTCSGGKFPACDAPIASVSYRKDADHDQHCVGAVTLLCAGQVDASWRATSACAAGDDCNDNDSTTYPGAPDTCDGKIHTCGSTACSCADGTSITCNAGACNVSTVICAQGKFPACPGRIDPQSYRTDADGDGYCVGSAAAACSQPPSSRLQSQCGAPDDCNDNDATTHPGAPDSCDRDHTCGHSACACFTNTTPPRACGLAGTQGTYTCTQGTSTCNNGAWSACANARCDAPGGPWQCGPNGLGTTCEQYIPGCPTGYRESSCTASKPDPNASGGTLTFGWIADGRCHVHQGVSSGVTQKATGLAECVP